jgi:ABC-type nickel/cobalt efflux system permease component RcnA
MKFGLLYRAEIAKASLSGPCELSYEDTNFPARAGWKEVVVKAGSNTSVTNSTAPGHDRSNHLSNYPTDLLNSPPQSLRAAVTFSVSAFPVASTSRAANATKTAVPITHFSERVGTAERADSAVSVPHVTASPPAKDQLDIRPNQQNTPRSAFTNLITTRNMGLGFGLLAVLIAAGLGALHALEPGHGKTIVAAYLVGSKGTARHAVLLGTIVTVSHTAGVYLLGAVTLYAQKYILPDKLYPLLGVLSGILIAGLGLCLFLQRYVGWDFAHSHTHGPGGNHLADLLGSHSPRHRSAEEELPKPPAEGSAKTESARQLLVLGITGGIVPCPAALVVLLSALALHRVVFGLLLIVSFSVGLAVVLIGLGMVAVHAGRIMVRLKTEGVLLRRWLPLTSSAMITIVGCLITIRGLMAAGIIQFRI